jgi:hypothetical protein
MDRAASRSTPSHVCVERLGSLCNALLKAT